MVSVYVKGLVLGALLIIASMASLWILDKQRINVISEQMQQMSWEMEDSRLFLNYLESMHGDKNAQCTIMKHRIIQQVEKADMLARKIDAYRNSNVFSPDYYAIKKTFIYKDFELFLQFKKLRDECNESVNYIIYFYAENDPDHSACPDCGVQASILDTVRNKCRNTWVFALPYNTDIDLVKVIEKQYNIQKVPALVINGERVYQGLTEADEIEKNIDCGENPLE
ncbi:MAG: thioredoxin family protein [Candidatus Diapherotrites archaeon]|nr:thioredoxin family protein [Candidatus Diapherotrites archaeon]